MTWKIHFFIFVLQVQQSILFALTTTTTKALLHHSNYVLNITQITNWQKAHDICSSLPGNFQLPIPLNDAENKLIMSLAKSPYVPLGITDKDSEGTWVNYYNGERINYTNWDKNEPANNWRIENYVAIWGEMSRWRDIRIDHWQAFSVVCVKSVPNKSPVNDYPSTIQSAENVVAIYDKPGLENFTEKSYFERLNYPQMTFDFVIYDNLTRELIIETFGNVINELEDSNGFISGQIINFIPIDDNENTEDTDTRLVTITAKLNPLDNKDKIFKEIESEIEKRLHSTGLVTNKPKRNDAFMIIILLLSILLLIITFYLRFIKLNDNKDNIVFNLMFAWNYFISPFMQIGSGILFNDYEY